MEFKARISYNFISTMSFLVMALVMTVFWILKAYYYTEVFIYASILMYVIGLTRLIIFRRYIYLMLYKKPVLITTGDYIYDVATETKYYRQDIEEIYEKNAYLYITLHTPLAYLNKIGDPVKRLITNINYEPDGKETPYKINLDLIDIDQDCLLEILDDYSIETTDVENLDLNESITYGFKWGGNLVLCFFLPVLYFLCFIIRFSSKSYWDDIIGALYMFLLITIVLPRFIKLCYFWIKKKPTLTVNESFISDQYANIIYYWNDVDEVIASDSYLQIKLYEPEKYIDKVRNPFRRFSKQIWYKRFNKKPSYSINLDIIDIKKEEHKKFLDSLNGFSIAAEA